MRLGLDIGTNSIGWWLYATDGDTADAVITEVIDGGVRIFSDGRDPKSKASLAVDRRIARGMRKRRDRYLRRRAALMRKLAEAGLMPADPAAAKDLELLDPYELRARGLDEVLPLTHLGRALFHLNQRRGFKSNRKTDRGDNESGKIKDATKRLDEDMAIRKARTYGEFLHMRRSTATDPRKVPSVRTRLTIARRDNAEKEEAGYDHYPDRRHLEGEFDTLWAAQAAHHPELTEELRDALHEIIFFQRPLKAPKVGKCLFTGEDRLPKAHPLTQRRVLYETVNNLRITADGRAKRPLTLEERNKVIHALDNKKPAKTLKSMALKLTALAKVLKLPDGQRFTLETGVRDAIACDPVRASLSHPDRFGPRWSALDIDAQWEVITRIRSVESEAEHDALVAWLEATHGLDHGHAQATSHAPLPEGHGGIGEDATRRILAALTSDVLTYNQAVAACGWHHSSDRTGEVLDHLPYYGEVLDRHVIPGTGEVTDDEITRFGRITNPTVHIGLNQLRRLVNLIITVYGKPDQIVVELARDLKMSDPQKKEAQKRIRDNTANAIRRSEQLEGLGIEDNGRNRMLLRHFEALGPAIGPRKCPYTGDTISATMVFDGSCDIDHILPYSRTLDDSFFNKTLCLRAANREKGNKTPWEAWGDSDRWPVIQANLKALDDKQRWRFAPDAMERFEGENSFLDRALVDTQYLSRIARTYLDTLFTEGGHVWVVPGRLTEMLRRHWGLNSLLSDGKAAVKAKNRTDHRHHAIDAAVIAATDRSLIQRISKAAKADEGEAREVARTTDAPWEHFREDIRIQLDRIIVSHRADHGHRGAGNDGQDSTVGALHQATALGLIDKAHPDAGHVAVRIPFDSVKPAHLTEGSRSGYLRDPWLRDQLRPRIEGKSGKDLQQALADFAATSEKYRGIRHVRILKALQEKVLIPVPADKPIKAYQAGSNHVFEIWRLPDGKIVSQTITNWEFHNLTQEKRPHPAAKRLLQVHKNDMVALERDGTRVIGTVQKTDEANGLFIVPHNEANADERNRNKDDPFKWIQISARPAVAAGIRRVRVDEMGRLRDPGPPR